ncbi:MAG: FISUMP domain-containing protein [bacterium]
MKKIVNIFFIVIILFHTINFSQSITGKLIDEKGNILSEIQVNLFIGTEIYTSISDSAGIFVINNITKVEPNQLPADYYVSDNFPNPFNPTTRFNITMPERGTVRAGIYNILGQSVANPIERFFEKGINYLDLEMNGLPNGIYFSQITIDNKYTVVRKMMLLYGSQHLAINNNTPHPLLKNSDKNFNIKLETKLDSLVATSMIIGSKTFTDLPSFTSNALDLGEFIIERYCPGVQSITYEGETYGTVRIGSQCWLKENLNVGNRINGNKDQQSGNGIEKYCYDDNETNCDTYGGLYQWNEAMQYNITEGTRGICPPEWHIPTEAEFKTLEMVVNQDGDALKEIGQGTSNEAATNKSGFSALLAGYRYNEGNFYNLGYCTTYFWSSSDDGIDSAYGFYIYCDGSSIYLYYDYEVFGFSVRCLKD